MPGGDRTGPHGQGSWTGAGRGRCTGGSGPGNGARHGRKGGFWGNLRNLSQGVTGEVALDEPTLLKQKISDMEESLAAMKERLAFLSKDGR